MGLCPGLQRWASTRKKHSHAIFGVLWCSGDNKGRCIDNLAGRQPIWTIRAPTSITNFYARCPSRHNPSKLSWLGTGTKYAGCTPGGLVCFPVSKSVRKSKVNRFVQCLTHDTGRKESKHIPLYHDSYPKRSGTPCLNEGSDSFTCHPFTRLSTSGMNTTFIPQLHRIIPFGQCSFSILASWEAKLT